MPREKDAIETLEDSLAEIKDPAVAKAIGALAETFGNALEVIEKGGKAKAAEPADDDNYEPEPDEEAEGEGAEAEGDEEEGEGEAAEPSDICAECGGDLGEEDKECPECGAPVKKSLAKLLEDETAADDTAANEDDPDVAKSFLESIMEDEETGPVVDGNEFMGAFVKSLSDSLDRIEAKVEMGLEADEVLREQVEKSLGRVAKTVKQPVVDKPKEEEITGIARLQEIVKGLEQRLDERDKRPQPIGSKTTPYKVVEKGRVPGDGDDQETRISKSQAVDILRSAMDNGRSVHANAFSSLDSGVEPIRVLRQYVPDLEAKS